MKLDFLRSIWWAYYECIFSWSYRSCLNFTENTCRSLNTKTAYCQYNFNLKQYDFSVSSSFNFFILFLIATIIWPATLAFSGVIWGRWLACFETACKTPGKAHSSNVGGQKVRLLSSLFSDIFSLAEDLLVIPLSSLLPVAVLIGFLPFYSKGHSARFILRAPTPKSSDGTTPHNPNSLDYKTPKPPYIRKNYKKSTLDNYSDGFPKHTHVCLFFRRGRLILSPSTMINVIDYYSSHYCDTIVLPISDYCHHTRSIPGVMSEMQLHQSSINWSLLLISHKSSHSLH